MLDKIKTMNDARSLVRDFYSVNADVFARPDTESCRKYAITECAEVIECDLRKDRPGDTRNSLKVYDMDTEIGDVKFMVLAYSLKCPDSLFKGKVVYGKMNINHVIDFILGALVNYDVIDAVDQLLWHENLEEDEIMLSIKKLQQRCNDKRSRK
jgi:hypothetical protein